MRFLKTFWFTNHVLNQNQRMHSVVRYLKWQIGSRLVPGPVAVKFVNDTRLLISAGMTGATGNIYTGLHEFEDMAFVLHSLRPKDLFVDVGSNIGSYTVLAGGVAGAHCIAFEPIPQTFAHLMENIRLNNLATLVEAQNIGIGAEKGVLAFTSNSDTTNHVIHLPDESISAVQVPVRTLDDVVGEASPRVIKIDVEGFETEVLRGAVATFRRNMPLAVIMELNGSGKRYGYDEVSLHQTMLDYGFHTFQYRPFLRELVSLQSKPNVAGNTLYIRNQEFFDERLKQSAPFLVNAHTI